MCYEVIFCNYRYPLLNYGVCVVVCINIDSEWRNVLLYFNQKTTVTINRNTRDVSVNNTVNIGVVFYSKYMVQMNGVGYIDSMGFCTW